MTDKEFIVIRDARIAKIKSTLANKGKEYAMSRDRLHNFNRAAAILGISREKALIGMATKHLVSILDIIDTFALYNTESPKLTNVTSEMVDEKIGDAINYLILLEAMLIEDMQFNFNYIKSIKNTEGGL